MKTYHLISDTHFNHTKLDDWGGRSGNWQERLLKGIHRIPEGSTLIHLGDICIGNDEEVHEKIVQVNPFINRILVRGNHDKKSSEWYLNRGWTFVCDGLDLNYMGHYLHLSHRPQRQRSNITHNIHGHTHGNLHRSEEYVEFYERGYHLDISPELVDFEVLRLDTLLKDIKNLKYPTP